jgi:hypothetical protein
VGGSFDIAFQPQIFSRKYDSFFKKMPPPSAHVKNEWSYTSTPPVRLRDMYREQLYFFYLQFYKMLLLRQPSPAVFRQQTVMNFRFNPTAVTVDTNRICFGYKHPLSFLSSFFPQFIYISLTLCLFFFIF